MNIILQRIKREMERQGMSQKTLAEKAGLTQCSVSRYFKGTREPKFSTLEKMCKAVKCNAAPGEKKTIRTLNVTKAIEYLYWGKNDEPVFDSPETDKKIMDFLRACSEEVVFEEE